MHFLFDHNSDLRLAIYKLLKMGLMGHFTTFWIDWIDWIDTMGSLPNRWKPALCKPRSSWKVTSHQSGVKRWRGCFPGLVIGPTHPNLSTLCQRTNLWVKKWSPFRLKFGLVIFCAKNHGAFRVPSFTCFPIFVPSIPDLVCWCLHSPLRCFLLMSLSTGWMLFDIVLVSFYSYSHAQKLLENADVNPVHLADLDDLEICRGSFYVVPRGATVQRSIHPLPSLPGRTLPWGLEDCWILLSWPFFIGSNKCQFGAIRSNHPVW